jgi:glucose dehydrogenase
MVAGGHGSVGRDTGDYILAYTLTDRHRVPDT